MRVTILSPMQEQMLIEFKDGYRQLYAINADNVSQLKTLQKNYNEEMDVNPNMPTAIRLKAIEAVIAEYELVINSTYSAQYRDAAIEECKDMGKTTALHVLNNRLQLIRETIGFPRREEKMKALDEAIVYFQSQPDKSRDLMQPDRTLLLISGLLAGAEVTDIEGRIYALQQETMQLMVKIYITNSVTGEKSESWGGAIWTDGWAELNSFRLLSDKISNTEILRLGILAHQFVKSNK